METECLLSFDMYFLNKETIFQFQHALKKERNTYRVKFIWEKNPALKAWYSFQSVSFCDSSFSKNLDENSNNESDMRYISWNELIDTFKVLLSIRQTDIAKLIWKNNAYLRYWYWGNEVKLSELVSNMADIPKPSIEENINNFKIISRGRCAGLIESMWDGNKVLQNWLAEQLKATVKNDSQQKVLDIFEAILASQCENMIQKITDCHHDFILKVMQLNGENEKERKRLLLKVFASSKSGESDFIKKYVSHLTNHKIIKEVMSEIIQKGNLSNYKKNHLKILKERLAQLVPSYQQTQTLQQVGIFKINRAINFPDNPSSAKKPRLHYVNGQKLIGCLSREVPTSGKLTVTEDLGQQLQQLPVVEKTALGITSVRKQPNGSSYYVKISDYQKYQRAHEIVATPSLQNQKTRPISDNLIHDLTIESSLIAQPRNDQAQNCYGNPINFPEFFYTDLTIPFDLSENQNEQIAENFTVTNTLNIK
ncbi:MAG: hypothetical protein Tsb005_13120 [Gammaproteobacteria bacterium]